VRKEAIAFSRPSDFQKRGSAALSVHPRCAQIFADLLNFQRTCLPRNAMAIGEKLNSRAAYQSDLVTLSKKADQS
jgi:hypothetical protein